MDNGGPSNGPADQEELDLYGETKMWSSSTPKRESTLETHLLTFNNRAARRGEVRDSRSDQEGLQKGPVIAKHPPWLKPAFQSMH